MYAQKRTPLLVQSLCTNFCAPWAARLQFIPPIAVALVWRAGALALLLAGSTWLHLSPVPAITEKTYWIRLLNPRVRHFSWPPATTAYLERPEGSQVPLTFRTGRLQNWKHGVSKEMRHELILLILAGRESAKANPLCNWSSKLSLRIQVLQLRDEMPNPSSWQ